MFRHQRNRFPSPDFQSDSPYFIEDFGDAGFEISMEVRGVEVNDISVDIDDYTLVISGYRRHSGERGFVVNSRFSQSFRLEDDIDVDGIVATLASGILTVAVPRAIGLSDEKHLMPVRRRKRERLDTASKHMNKSSENQENDFELLEVEDN